MKKTKSIAKALLALTLVFSFGLTGCSSAGDSSKDSAKKSELVVGVRAEATSLDPQGIQDNGSNMIKANIFETLVVQDENLDIKPGLAESWEQVDPTTIVFKLRKGVKFTNGEDFKASDVKFTLERATNSAYTKAVVATVDPNNLKVIDEHTIEVKLLQPFAPILAHLAQMPAAIVNEKAITEAGDKVVTEPVGTGPFKLASWNKGDKIELVRNDEYWGDKPSMEKIVCRTITEDSNRTIELETGSIDMAIDVSSTDIKRIDEMEEVTLEKISAFNNSWLGFNMKSKELQDVNVRKAISYAIDKDGILDTAYNGSGTIPLTPLASSVWGYNDNPPKYDYNIEKAKEYLSKSAYPNGFKTTITTDESRARLDSAEIIQNQLAEIGIEVEVKVLERAAYLSATEKGETDLYLIGWLAVAGDPDYGLYPVFHSSMFGASGNRAFFKDEQVDNLLDKGRNSIDKEERKQAYLDCQARLMEVAACVPLQEGQNLVAYKNNVKGFVPNSSGNYNFKNIVIE